MRAAEFKTIVPALPPASLPLESHQSTCRVGAVGTLALVAPAGLALLAPFAAVAGLLVAEPAARQTLVERPGSGLLLAIGLVIWCALLALPLWRAVDGLARSRRVVIANGFVTVSERGLTGRRQWTEPVAAFTGVMHLVRTTLSSTRHELVLVHPDTGRSVLLAVADQISEQQIGAFAALLGRQVVPANARFGFKAVAAGWPAAAAMPAATKMPVARAA